MRKQGGFTLVELMVVVSITILLLAWGVPSYSSWKKKHEVENQVFQLYSDLQFARMNAYSHKAVSGIWWNAGTSLTSYQIRSDKDGDQAINDSGGYVQIGNTVTSKYTIGITTPSGSTDSVTFDGRGFLVSPTPPPVVFYISPNYGAANDCVEVSSTRITVGKKNGSTCSPK